MKPCQYVVSGDVLAVGDVAETGYPRPCIVWSNTVVLRPMADVEGPCSAAKTSKCEKPRQEDTVVWYRWGSKYFVYKRAVAERVEALVDAALSESQPASVLLAGASRTGKSSLAQIVLLRRGLPFIHISGDSVLGKYVGESEESVRSLIRGAIDRGHSVVIDEVDGMFPTVGRYGRESEEVVKTRTAFLASMDALIKSRKPVFVFATTNVDVNLFPEEVRNRFQFVVEFPKPSPEEYDLYMRLIGADGAVDVKLKAVASMATYDAVYRCVKVGICDFKPERVVVYVQGRISAVTPSAVELLKEIRRLVSIAQPLSFSLSGHSGEFQVESAAVALSVVTGKAVVITRDREEYVDVVREARYYDVVVAPLEDTIQPQDVWLAYRRVPLALLEWRNPPSGVRKVTLPLDSYTVDKEKARDWVREKTAEVVATYAKT